jgi:urea transport system substrate-binding protein
MRKETPGYPGPPPDPWVGRKLGQYQFVARLARGGMGVVYEARDLLLQRPVAIKMLAERIAADPAGLRRFLREARGAGQLSHPHVVTVYEIVEEANQYFLVMELLAGESCQALLDRNGPLPWPQATRFAAQACQGLAAAHAQGLIHRDIKPANLLLGPGGQVKVSDFGLARNLAAEVTPLTQPRMICGTAQYMSPEQINGASVDERSDVYSLGATYFALLTGMPPYPGSDMYSIMYAHCGQAIPDPRSACPELPPAGTTIIQKALAKSPRDRYPSVTALQHDLEALLNGVEDNSPAPTAAAADTLGMCERIFTGAAPAEKWQRPRWGRWRLVVAGVLLALAVSLALWWVSRDV